jgi:hypothetical protein
MRGGLQDGLPNEYGRAQPGRRKRGVQLGKRKHGATKEEETVCQGKQQDNLFTK